MVIELTEATFDKFIEENPIAIIDCWAPWCGPCRKMGPIMEEVAVDLAGKAGVAKLNVDNNEAVSARFSIRAIPTLLIFKNKVLLEPLVGLRSKAEVIKFVEGL